MRSLFFDFLVIIAQASISVFIIIYCTIYFKSSSGHYLSEKENIMLNNAIKNASQVKILDVNAYTNENSCINYERVKCKHAEIEIWLADISKK